MSAPQIPNLNSLRRGGLKGRGRGSGTQDGWRPDQPQRKQNKDEIIRNTDHDAATSRLSAVEAGYLDDPFARLLSTSDEVTRRLPLMNRGTYTRTTAIDAICRTFINSLQESSSHPPHRPLNFHGIQIISLGAGSDTRFFRLRRLHHHEDIRYREFDFPENTTEKIARITKPEFIERVKQKAHLGMDGGWVEVLDEGRRLRSGMYCVTPLDLRTLAEDPGKAAGALEDVDPSLPTLLISECCLCYLSPEHADAVLKYFTDLFPATTPLATVIYEPIRPFDSFGRTMVSNLTGRGIQLQTLERYADLKQQRERLGKYGFGERMGDSGMEGADRDAREDSEGKEGGEGGAEAADIDFIWTEWVSDEEKERVEKLEWMDEVEEFVLLGKHYCVSWGWRGFGWDGDGDWKGLRAPT